MPGSGAGRIQLIHHFYTLELSQRDRERESAEELENPHIHRDRERDRERGIKKRTQEIDRTNLTRFYPTSDI